MKQNNIPAAILGLVITTLPLQNCNQPLFDHYYHTGGEDNPNPTEKNTFTIYDSFVHNYAKNQLVLNGFINETHPGEVKLEIYKDNEIAHKGELSNVNYSRRTIEGHVYEGIEFKEIIPIDSDKPKANERYKTVLYSKKIHTENNIQPEDRFNFVDYNLKYDNDGLHVEGFIPSTLSPESQITATVFEDKEVLGQKNFEANFHRNKQGIEGILFKGKITVPNLETKKNPQIELSAKNPEFYYWDNLETL